MAFLGKGGRTAACANAFAAPADKRIGHHAHELCHGVDGGLLRANSGFARDLAQPCRGQCRESQRNAAGGIEEIGQRIADIGLVAVEAAGDSEAELEVEIGVVGVVAQARGHAGRQVAVDERAEGAAAEAAGGVEDGVLPGHVTARRKARIHGRAAERRGAGDVDAVGIRWRHLDHVGRGRGETEIAAHRQRADRIARRQRAA